MPDSKPNLWGATDTYERYMGRWSRKVAPLFLDWLNAPKEQNWIDIGCGTGELTSLIADKCNPAQLMGIDPSDGYIKFAKDHIKSANFEVGNALKVGLPDSSRDLAGANFCRRMDAKLLLWVVDSTGPPLAANDPISRLVVQQNNIYGDDTSS